MVSKKGKRGLVTGSGSKASGLSSKGRSSVVAEASCRGEWLENVEAPAHSSAAMCHRPCGHSATGEPVRSRHPGRPAGYHVGATRAITGPPPPGGVHPPQLQLLRPGACSSHGSDPDRLKAGCKAGTSAPPQLAAAGANKGIPFLSGCEAEPPPASTHCRDGGWSVGCKLQEDPLAAQPCNAFLFVSSLLLFLLFLLFLLPPLPTKDQTGSPCISNH